jgi:hypothetical protein
MQKKPAVLLEILIALTLMMLVLVPLIQKPMQFHRAEKERIRRIEANRIAAWTYSEIREKFLKGEFRWEEIPALSRVSKTYKLPPMPLLLPPVADKSIRRSFHLKTMREKEHEGKISRLVAIEIEIDGHIATYRLILEKKDSLSFNSALLH